VNGGSSCCIEARGMLIDCRCCSFRTRVFVCVPPSQDVLVLGRYTSMDHSTLSLRDGRPDSDGLRSAIKVTVTDPRQDVLLTHDTTAEGKFAFTSVVGGEHLICLATNTTSWYGQQRNFVSFFSHHPYFCAPSSRFRLFSSIEFVC
jgi:hypothetical protein